MVILIHGFNMDLNTWMNNFDFLITSHKVYALDLWGFGFSTRESLDWDLDLFVEQLILFMDALEIEKATLVGHSMGGGTAMVFTASYPHRVDKLLLVDSVGPPYKMAARSKLITAPWLPEILLGVSDDYLRKKNPGEIWLYH